MRPCPRRFAGAAILISPWLSPLGRPAPARPARRPARPPSPRAGRARPPPARGSPRNAFARPASFPIPGCPPPPGHTVGPGGGGSAGPRSRRLRTPAAGPVSGSGLCHGMPLGSSNPSRPSVVLAWPRSGQILNDRLIIVVAEVGRRSLRVPGRVSLLDTDRTAGPAREARDVPPDDASGPGARRPRSRRRWTPKRTPPLESDAGVEPGRPLRSHPAPGPHPHGLCRAIVTPDGCCMVMSGEMDISAGVCPRVTYSRR